MRYSKAWLSYLESIYKADKIYEIEHNEVVSSR